MSRLSLYRFCIGLLTGVILLLSIGYAREHDQAKMAERYLQTLNNEVSYQEQIRSERDQAIAERDEARAQWDRAMIERNHANVLLEATQRQNSQSTVRIFWTARTNTFKRPTAK